MNERTPEQLRNDRRAGIGCGLVLLLAGLGLIYGGFAQLSDEGTKTQARILSCDIRVLRQPWHCRGIWSKNGEFFQGYVDGATNRDVGKRITVWAKGENAEASSGKHRTGIILFVLAAGAIFFGIGFAHSAWRKRPAPD
jgi:hypothetical protein